MGCPHPFDVGELLGIGFFQVDDAVCPIGQVAGFEQDDAGIVFPTVLSGEHVCGRDIKGMPVFSAQDVRVADTPAFADGVGSDDRAVSVECTPVHSVITAGGAQMFLLFGISSAFEISEKIAFIISRCFGSILCRLSVAHGRS